MAAAQAAAEEAAAEGQPDTPQLPAPQRAAPLKLSPPSQQNGHGNAAARRGADESGVEAAFSALEDEGNPVLVRRLGQPVESAGTLALPCFLMETRASEARHC